MHHQNIHEYTCTTYTYIHHQTHVHYIHDHTCTIYKYIHHMYHQKHTWPYMHHQTHVHHQIPPKYKIYPVGLPSVLYEKPGPNERSVLNQLFLVLFIVLFTFQVLFTKTAMLFTTTRMLFMKTATFHENHNSFHIKFCELLGYHQV